MFSMVLILLPNEYIVIGVRIILVRIILVILYYKDMKS